MRVAGEEQKKSKRLDHLQCRRVAKEQARSARGLGVWVWLCSLRANVQREAAACPSEIQRQIRMERVLVALLLVHSLLAAACALLGAAKSIAGGPQAPNFWPRAVFGPAIILAPFPAGQASRSPALNFATGCAQHHNPR